MPTTDGGIWYPDTTYAADSLTTAFATMASSVDEELLTGKVRIYQVADSTERDALATALNPSVSNPLFVFRADITTDRNLEWTTNGSTWNSYLPPASGVASNSAVTTKPTSTTNSSIALPTVVTSGNIASASNGFSITRSGTYLVTARVLYYANANGNRECAVFVNGAATYLSDIRAASNLPNSSIVNAVGPLDLDAGDVVTLQGWQNSGSTLNVSNPSLTLFRLT